MGRSAGVAQGLKRMSTEAHFWLQIVKPFRLLMKTDLEEGGLENVANKKAGRKPTYIVSGIVFTLFLVWKLITQGQ